MTTQLAATGAPQPMAAGDRGFAQTNGNGKNGSDRISVFRFASLPGLEVLVADGSVPTGRPLLHNDLEIRFVVRGELRVDFNHSTQVGQAGWLVRLPPGQLHSLAPAMAAEHSFLALRVGLEDLDRYGGRPGRARSAPPMFACEPAPAEIAELVSAAFLELIGMHEPNGASETTRSALSKLIAWAAQAPTHSASSAATRLPAIERALDHMRERYLREISLDDLASAAGLSKFHFLRLFSVALGATPHRYQLLLRIARAREMLRQGADIASVAQGTGFFDQSHFTRCFREIVGITPGRYRNEGAARAARNGAPSARGPANGPQARSEFGIPAFRSAVFAADR